MLVTINQLKTILKSNDKDIIEEQLTQLVLEAIATNKDNELMNELMLDMIYKNSLLNKELNLKLEEIKKLSVTDQLTGLFNRRKFIEVLEQEIIKTKRYNNVFSIIMFDIDHFKSVNDTYGHDVGDFVLKELSKIVSDRIRASDLFARWGGEEFMLLLPETDSENSFVLAEDIRHLIETHDFSPVKKLTSSFGCITCNDKSLCNLTLLTKNVDEALYEAKETGRNKVIKYKHSSDSNTL